eukprot:6180616-Pleurochrysis_carterae.AAC.1
MKRWFMCCCSKSLLSAASLSKQKFLLPADTLSQHKAVRRQPASCAFKAEVLTLSACGGLPSGVCRSTMAAPRGVGKSDDAIRSDVADVAASSAAPAAFVAAKSTSLLLIRVSAAALLTLFASPSSAFLALSDGPALLACASSISCNRPLTAAATAAASADAASASATRVSGGRRKLVRSPSSTSRSGSNSEV